MEPTRNALSVATMNQVVGKESPCAGFGLYTSIALGILMSYNILDRQDNVSLKGKVVYASAILAVSIVFGIFSELFLKEVS